MPPGSIYSLLLLFTLALFATSGGTWGVFAPALSPELPSPLLAACAAPPPPRAPSPSYSEPSTTRCQTAGAWLPQSNRGGSQ